jgi:23S rRNA pseudouridine955/2504/2580 synthase
MNKHERVPATLVTISAADAGRRIDNFLLSSLKGVPRARVYRMLRRGEVRLNGRRVAADRRLAADDEVRIPPATVAAPGRAAHIPEAVLERLERAVLYEDERVLAVNKPPHLTVHSGTGLSWGVIDALRLLRPHTPFLELAHRLDRETSGCLIAAKDRQTLRRLHDAFRARTARKHYLALVQGAWPRDLDRLEAPLSRRRDGEPESRVAVDPAGKAAATRVYALESVAGATLLDIQLLTGRTHQARVHAAAAGHPIAGDRKYGDARFNAHMRGFGLTRLFLHADCLDLVLDPGSERLSLRAPLSEDLAAVLEKLRAA